MDLDNITTLAGKFESYAELQSYCDQQFAAIQALSKENQALKNEISHLKDLLSSTTTLLSSEAVKFDIGNEQAICEVQIEKLREKAFMRELTLEETKRFEILVKSLHAIREKSPSSMEPDYAVLPSARTIEQLTHIAASPDPQPEAD